MQLLTIGQKAAEEQEGGMQNREEDLMDPADLWQREVSLQ